MSTTLKLATLPYKVKGWKYIHYRIREGFTLYPEHCYMFLANILMLPLCAHRIWWESKHPSCVVTSYKEFYTIYRPDDPRSYRIRCSPDLPPNDPHILPP